jgi:NADPH2:quinone reductase
MRAAVYYSTGAPEVFRYEEVPDPVPAANEILVDVKAIGIEGGDTLNRAGGDLTQVPHIVGYQCAGLVSTCGDDVKGFSVGDRVVVLGLDGSHAERRAVPENFAWRIPDGLGFEEAACIPVAFATAHDCLFHVGRLQVGETALVHAGAGGVGIVAIQMAKRAGATVLATASSEEKLERLGDFGLDHGINYRTHEFGAEVRRLTDGRGVDVVLDSVGGPNLQESIRVLAYRGRCVSLGNAGRSGPMPIDVSTMGVNNQMLAGYFLGGELFMDVRAYGVVAQLLQEVAEGSLEVVIDSVFPLDDAADAHARAEGRRAFGRVVLVP